MKISRSKERVRKERKKIFRPFYYRKKRERIKKEKVRRRLKWTNIDRGFVHFLSKRRKKWLTLFLRIMTHIGDGIAWFILCAVFLGVDLSVGLALTISSLLQVGFQQIIKHIFVRQRPYVKYEEISVVMAPPDKFSFPSGHTAGAFAIAFVFYYLFPVLFIPMLIVASLIAFSRIYLGLHYPSDIIAGVILGFVSAKLGIYLAQIFEVIRF